MPNWLLIGLGIVSTTVLCFVLVWIAFQGSAKYEASRAKDESGYPTLQPYQSPDQQYSEQVQNMQASEAQIRQQGGAVGITSQNQDLQRQFDNLEFQKDLMKTRKAF